MGFLSEKPHQSTPFRRGGITINIQREKHDLIIYDIILNNLLNSIELQNYSNILNVISRLLYFQTLL